MSNPNTILILQTNFRFVEKATRKSNPTQNLFRGNTTNKPNNDAKETCAIHPSTWEAQQAAHPWVWGQPVPQCEFLDRQSYTFRPCLKKRERDEEEQRKRCRVKKKGRWRGGRKKTRCWNYPDTTHIKKQKQCSSGPGTLIQVTGIKWRTENKSTCQDSPESI